VSEWSADPGSLVRQVGFAQSAFDALEAPPLTGVLAIDQRGKRNDL
jgi:hypothetical protein